MNYLKRLLLTLLLASPVFAKNVDLSTVPKRDTVELTIYNSEDLTLVRETRNVTFKKGVNPLQFSWANTLIDPSSVQLRFLTNAEKMDVVDTTFPHDKPQMLYWNVQSEIDAEARIEITYFTSGITWSADYVGVSNAAQNQMKLDGFVRVTNNSGEDYDSAHVRLVVGTINLVEKIAQLARIPMSEVRKMNHDRLGEMRTKAAKVMMDLPAPTAAAGEPAAPPQEKAIIKEGLSEYFIFAVEGAETIPNGWSKRMRSMHADDVPVKIQYRYRPEEYGDQLVRMYLLTNNKASKLGDSPLPDGAVRIFRDNGRGGLSYIVAQDIKYIPIGDKIELNLGHDPNVIFELVKLKTSRDNIWMQINGGNVFRKVGAPGVKIEVNSAVAGWDDHETYTQRIRNFSPDAIDVEIRRSFDGHNVFRSGLKPTLHDYRTVQFTATVAAGARTDHLFELVRHEGHNARQNNVTLEDAAIAAP